MKSDNRPPISWYFYHPYQRFWNRPLCSLIKRIIPLSFVNWRIIKGLEVFDTFVGWVGTVFGWIKIKLLFPNFKVRPGNHKVVYFDLGTHKEGKELELVLNRVLSRLPSTYYAVGFEANEESFKCSKSKFSDFEGVRIENLALCYDLPSSGYITLYKNPGGGFGDSLYRQTDQSIEVRAGKLSEWINQSGIDLSSCACIIRMNVEGAEYDVIKDLLDSGLLQFIDGFYGSWDDVYKASPERDKEFRALLRKYKISALPFNERDIHSNFRVNWLLSDIKKSIIQGLIKKGG